MRFNEFRNARQILTDSLNVHWDSGLAALYGDVAGDDTLEQIDQAERWLAQHHSDAALLLSLGKLCVRQRLWGKAEAYLDASISLTPSHDAYMKLGQLAEELNKPNEASACFRKAMDLQGRG
jgi:HemY protein